jgi:hypothetical protein
MSDIPDNLTTAARAAAAYAVFERRLSDLRSERARLLESQARPLCASSKHVYTPLDCHRNDAILYKLTPPQSAEIQARALADLQSRIDAAEAEVSRYLRELDRLPDWLRDAAMTGRLPP